MDNNRKTFLPMKNLLVITLLFSSFAISKQILDCERDTDPNDTFANFSDDFKIVIHAETFLPIKTGTLIEYNLVPLNVTYVTAGNIFAERKYESEFGSTLIHKLQIGRNTTFFSSTYYRVDDGERTKTNDYRGGCKLR